MKSFEKNPFATLVCQVLMAGFLFLSTGSSPGTQKYLVKIYAGAETSICIGQSTTLTVAYSLSEGQIESALPVFTMQASNGTITPASSTGGAGSGFVFFTFTATQSGVAKITATANMVDGSNTATFRVLKDCTYSYKLVITLNVTSVYGGITFQWEDVVTAEGMFTPASIPSGDPNLAPLTPLNPVGKMTEDLTVLEFQPPPQDDCNIATLVFTKLGGDGTVAVNGQLDSSTDGGVTITLDNPHVKGGLSYSVKCKHGTLAQDLPVDISSSDSPWIQESFPGWGGSSHIKIDIMEKGIENLKKSAGTTASYTATLTVRRVK